MLAEQVLYEFLGEGYKNPGDADTHRRSCGKRHGKRAPSPQPLAGSIALSIATRSRLHESFPPVEREGTTALRIHRLQSFQL